jgi:hypothetical protein
MPSCGILRRVALVRTDVSEELSASIIRMTRIGELGTILAVTSYRRVGSYRNHTANIPEDGILHSHLRENIKAYICMCLCLPRFTPKEVIDFFRRMTKETVTYRQQNNVKRNDFLQLLIELKEKTQDLNNSKDKSIPWHKSKYNLDSFTSSGRYFLSLS